MLKESINHLIKIEKFILIFPVILMRALFPKVIYVAKLLVLKALSKTKEIPQSKRKIEILILLIARNVK